MSSQFDRKEWEKMRLKNMTDSSHAVGATPREIYETYNRANLNKAPMYLPESMMRGIPDNLIDGLNMVNDFKSFFDRLPSEMRATFKNNHVEFGQFVSKATVEELTKLGLLKKVDKPTVVPPLGSKDNPMHVAGGFAEDVPESVPGTESAPASRKPRK